jgi:hypothetical protein
MASLGGGEEAITCAASRGGSMRRHMSTAHHDNVTRLVNEQGRVTSPVYVTGNVT